MNHIYVSAEGYVIPCCWIGNEPFMAAYRDLHKGYLEELNIRCRSLEDIVADPRYQKIADSWKSWRPFKPCRHFCSKPLPKNTEDMQGTNAYTTIEISPSPENQS